MRSTLALPSMMVFEAPAPVIVNNVDNQVGDKGQEIGAGRQDDLVGPGQSIGFLNGCPQGAGSVPGGSLTQPVAGIAIRHILGAVHCKDRRLGRIGKNGAEKCDSDCESKTGPKEAGKKKLSSLCVGSAWLLGKIPRGDESFRRTCARLRATDAWGTISSHFVFLPSASFPLNSLHPAG